MHFTSERTGGFQVFAVTGINTVSFAVDFHATATDGLLGFAVERHDPTEDERYFMYGFKVFENVIPAPEPTLAVSTFDHPVQSFVWDDFTAKPGRPYTYWFHPLRGKPKNLDRTSPPIRIKVETEPMFSNLRHDVFFNRGVASSQAYTRRFGNKRPDKLTPPARQQAALDWLSRDLDDALFAFIDAAGPEDTILGCFYEFNYLPAIERLKAAQDRGVTLRLILDGKDNSRTDKNGKFHEATPREATRRALAEVGLPDAAIAGWRTNNRNDIQHNKFMVLLQGPGQAPAEVWAGSTNLTAGGVHGQTNVGHWLRDPAVAAKFVDYWTLLETDPGGRTGETRTQTIARRAAFRDAVEALDAVPERWQDIPQGTSVIFSPRSGSGVLNMYVDMLDEASVNGAVTLAFGINKAFKTELIDNTAGGPVLFFLLEKRDKPHPRARDPFVPLTARQNIYQAWGSTIRDPVYQWARETNARSLGFNRHVAYVHSKFLLKDPLSADPIVISGSANFSGPSVNTNDENMLAIRGEERPADIYFTEFNRLFNHYYFRSVREAIAERRASDGNASADTSSSLFLDETGAWLQKYAPGKLRRKRLDIFTGMANARVL